MTRPLTALRALTLGLLLSVPALAQTTPSTDSTQMPETGPSTDPSANPAPTDQTPTTDQPSTDQAPATEPAAPDTAPADTTTKPAPAALSADLPTVPALDGETVLKTVPTVLGQAVVYSGDVSDALTRTVDLLTSEGYSEGAGTAQTTLAAPDESNVALQKSGERVQLRVTQKLGLTLVAISRTPETSATTAAPIDTATPDTTTPSTDTLPSSDPSTPDPTAPDTAAPATEETPSTDITIPEPDPTAPDPTTPDTTTPDPSVPDPATPDTDPAAPPAP